MTSIEWTDTVWNPTVGCSRVSAGCDHCYAMHFAHRGMSPDWAALTKMRRKDASRPGIDWTGEVRTLAQRLTMPLRWRKARRVFVDSMSDLFHPQVPLEFIAAVFGVMAACPQHTFQVLTKRPQRAREFFEWMGDPQGRMYDAICEQPVDWPNTFYDDEGVSIGTAIGDSWPLPNVWLGTSVEDQATADERVDEVLRCPAALHFVSYEPALGAADFSRWLWPMHESWPAEFKWPDDARAAGAPVSRHRQALVHAGRVFLDLIIVGGGSGQDTRPFDIRWGRSVIEQTRGTGCAAFMKQIGACPHSNLGAGHAIRLRRGASRERFWTFDENNAGVITKYCIRNSKGGDPSEWPEDLRVREMPATRRRA